jgi:preprotein translocase subunit SecA
MFKLLKKIFKTSNDRVIQRMMVSVKEINSLENTVQKQTEQYFKDLKSELLASYNSNDKQLESILPLAFAATREASVRTLGLRHFDSQLLGGMALSEGNIAEMKTGEGKTLVATLPAFLNASIGNKTVLVTVNDYLAKRDAEWMKPVYEYLGLTVGVVYSNQDPDEKKQAYASDIIYATNNELGFDYLRDNMAHRTEDKVQCSLDFAIIDEVDSILIDEARTPLIISGPSAESSEMYKKIKRFIPELIKQDREETEEEPLSDDERGHFVIDEKNRTIDLTDDGYLIVETMLEDAGIIGQEDGLYSVSNLKIMKFVQASLKASFLFKKNVHYLVRNNEVMLIDEHTGRTMPGRRISEGVHQALECKENVTIQRESQTLASTTFQNFFRLFKTLSGMTGTADTEAPEFREIYNLNVVIIPTNVPMARSDMNDLVFQNTNAKFKALVNEIVEIREKSAPVLVGTASVESSEVVSDYLTKAKIPHQVLNAKHHEKEAEIIANAGRPGVVTIATNMAGRGTDIVLGGNKEDQDPISWEKNNKTVLEAGGLHILGTERHESRRIDNQLRGRSGRQGDPGYSRFFLSMNDDLLRLFITDSRKDLFEKMGMKDEAIEHGLLSRSIENSQRRIEARNFDARKNLLEYDDVSNDQRKATYSLRDQLLEEESINDTIQILIEQQFRSITHRYVPLESIESQWRLDELDLYLQETFNLETSISLKAKEDKKLLPTSIAENIIDFAKNHYKDKYTLLGENLKDLERQIMLQVLDVHWKEHLAEIDHLRGSVGLRAYAQKNPKNEFKKEAFHMFQGMLDEIDFETIRVLFSLKISSEEDLKNTGRKSINDENELILNKENNTNNNDHANFSGTNNAQASIKREDPKIGRNELVKISNGKETKEIKYKKAQALINSGEWKVL